MEYIKNPIVIGVLMGSITYAYLYWMNEKKSKENPNEEKQKVNLLIPLGVVIVSWFLSSMLLDRTDDSTNVSDSGKHSSLLDDKNVSYKHSYKLTNGIKLPESNLLIDLARFD